METMPDVPARHRPGAREEALAEPSGVRLGTWTCPSGNGCDVFLDGAVVRFEWDQEPPLTAADERDYRARILPAVVRLVQEFLEKPGTALVIQL